MKMGRLSSNLLKAIFLSLALTVSSLSMTLDAALLKLERDISLNASSSVISRDVERVRAVLNDVPVGNVPEVFYLTGDERFMEKGGRISVYRRLLGVSHVFLSALTVVCVVLSAYLSILFLQSLPFEEGIRNTLTLLFLIILAVLLVARSHYLPALFSFSASAGFALKRYRLSALTVLFSVLLISAWSVEGTLSGYLFSKRALLQFKLERDGYAPPFLIESVKDPDLRRFEEIANRQSFGYLNLAKEYERLKTPPSLKPAVLNNIGVDLYRRKNFNKALRYFKKAYHLSKSPKILYNVYLTYLSKLDFENANRISKQLRKVPSGIKTVPFVMHVSDVEKVEPAWGFMWKPFLVFAALLFLSPLFSRVKLYPDRVLPVYYLIPGFNNFKDKNYLLFSMFVLLLVSISVVVEVLLCL